MNRLRVGFSRSASAGVPTLAMLLALGLGAPVGAQPTPHGPQFQVNSYTPDAQQEPSVALRPDGSFVVAWQSWSSPGDDQEQSSVQARLFAADGSPASDQWQVNTSTTGTEDGVRVATTPSGGFIVVWCAEEPNDPDPVLVDIRARRYDAAGAPLGADFLVNSDTADSQHRPAIAVDPVTGEFFVAWIEDADESIQARRFEANGTPSGLQFAVNQVTGDQQYAPAVAPLGDGRFVVAWESLVSPGDDPDWSVQVLRFDATGAPIGDQLQVNTGITGYQDRASVAGYGDGAFFIAWNSETSGGDDADGNSIQARRFDASGAPLGPEFQVNTQTAGHQSRPNAAVDSHGHVLVVWAGETSAGTDHSGWSVHGRRYDAAGDPIGDEFQINSYTAGDQAWPWVANNAPGDFVVVWNSLGSYGTDNNSTSIQAQLFDDVFREDFESGTLERWSTQVP